MSSPKAPAAPDPQKTAAAQTATNVATAQANAAMGNVNQVTPYGNLTYTASGKQFISDPTSGQSYWTDGKGNYQTNAPGMVSSTSAATTRQEPIYRTTRDGQKVIQGYRTVSTPGQTTTSAPEGWSQVKGYYVPQYTATQTLSPQQQAILNQNQAAELNLAGLANSQSKRLQGLLDTPFNLNGLPAAGDPSKLNAPQYQQLLGNAGLQTSLGNQGAIRGNVANAGNIQTGLGNAGNITKSYSTDFSADRTKVENALLARMNPQLANDRAALEQRLANAGVVAGSEAYNRAVDEANRSASDARYGAILAGGQEQSRLVGLEADRAAFQNAAQNQQFSQNLAGGQFANAAQQQQYGQNLSNATFANAAQQQKYAQAANTMEMQNAAKQQQFQNSNAAIDYKNSLGDRGYNNQISQLNAQNQARATALNERFALRNQPLNEIAALMSGSQVQNPNFVNANMPQIATTDYAGLVQQNYANQMQAYQQAQAQRQSLLGGVLGLGSSLIMASDRRVKTDIKAIGKLNDGQKLYSYRYKGTSQPQVGLMAQEVEKRKPDAVKTIGGVKHVDYGKAIPSLLTMGSN